MSLFKKINASIISLLIAILLFGTVTYAWLTMSIINHIDQMSITATGGQELEISFDGVNYDHDIPLDALSDLLENIELDDVTSYDGIEFIRGGTKKPVSAIKNIDYVSFDLYFRTTRPERYVYLVNNVNHKVLYDTSVPGTYVVSRGVSWKPKIDYFDNIERSELITTEMMRTYYAKDSIRMSFIEKKLSHPIQDERPLESLKTVIYDPSENELRSYQLGMGAHDYYEKVTGNILQPIRPFPDVIYQLSSFHELNPYQAIDDASNILELQPTGTYDGLDRPYFAGRVTVNIWVEGWDPDSFDCILEDRLKIQLQFKLARSYEQYQGIN